MKYDESDIKNLIKYLYGLVDYTASENIITKTIFFYTSEEEKNIFEKNNIFCLSKDCTKDDIQDVFKNKFLSEKIIALYASANKRFSAVASAWKSTNRISGSSTLQSFSISFMARKGLEQ